jgi:hypothetical protein
MLVQNAASPTGIFKKLFKFNIIVVAFDIS